MRPGDLAVAHSRLDLKHSFSLLLVLTLFGSGCSSYQPTAPSGVWTNGEGEVAVPEPRSQNANLPLAAREPAAPGAYRLRGGDILGLRIAHLEPIDEPRLVLDESGRVDMPFLGSVEAGGKGIEELRQELIPRFAEIFSAAPVTLRIVDRHAPNCAVLGQVGRPGEIAIEGGATLIEVISRAGGFTYLDRRDALGASDLGRAFVSREGGLVPVDFEALFLRGDTRENIRMQDGDLVMIPDNTHREVVVLGSVNDPKVVPMAAGAINVLTAIGHAGGFHRHADMTKVAVIRQLTGAEPLVRIVDIEGVLDARDRDLRLENGDVIFVARDDIAALELHEVLKSAASGFVTAVGAASLVQR
jgi:polysaccharide biosynthesis/export protein